MIRGTGVSVTSSVGYIISRYIHVLLSSNPPPPSPSIPPLAPAFGSAFSPFSALFHMQNHRRRSIVAHCGIGSLGPVYHTSFISPHRLLRASSEPLLALSRPIFSTRTPPLIPIAFYSSAFQRHPLTQRNSFRSFYFFLFRFLKLGRRNGGRGGGGARGKTRGEGQGEPFLFFSGV